MNEHEVAYQRELLAFNEKIALARLEKSKAEMRVNELKYQRERFVLDMFQQTLHHAQQK